MGVPVPKRGQCGKPKNFSKNTHFPFILMRFILIFFTGLHGLLIIIARVYYILLMIVGE